MAPVPRNIEEALRYAAEDYERLQREADESAAAKEREATAFHRLMWWLVYASKSKEAKP